MGFRVSLLMWRLCAALFFGAVLVLGVTALSSPAGDLIPARLAQEPAEEPAGEEPTEDSSQGDATDADRPASEDTDGLPRLVGTPPNVDVEVLSGTSSSDEAADVGHTEPASQVVATPKFTG